MKVSWARNILSLAVVAVMTQSCIMYRLEELRHTTPSGNGFQNALSKLYMDFATAEEKDYDWANSWHFADKGLMLAYGKDVGPEDLADWNIPDDALPEMQKARILLMSVLTPQTIHEYPNQAAEAQFYFDCWVEQQEENWQTEDIAFCRDNLMRSLEALHATEPTPKTKSAAKEKTAEKKAAAQKASEPKPAAKPVAKAETKPAAVKEVSESTSYAVFFETDKAQLSEPGKNVINEVIESVKNTTNYEIILRVNSSKSVLDTLSNERAQVVKKRLVDAGISESLIRRSDTAANPSVPAPIRRIEIFINE